MIRILLGFVVVGVGSVIAFSPVKSPALSLHEKNLVVSSARREPISDRRSFAESTAAMISAAVLASAPISAQAGGTTIDIQRYGDKELKIAAINKVKQLLRNELLQNPAQAGDWVKLALSDALSFNVASDSGGADASVAYDDALLKANPAFAKAVGTLKGVQKAVLKTTEVSLSDVLAYAGAEAIEASGGPRIAVQIGRYDADKVVENASPHLSWVGEGAAADVVKAFKASGFGVRECAVLVGAIGSVERASGSAAGGKIKARVDPLDSEDELFPADGGIFIPSTFGSQKAMFGELLSNVCVWSRGEREKTLL
mmetsp:Transcript_32606/g.66562  ORF Transcript_32606/g.66562 Transcript_32606/m.66562 type:complete len:313 (+) Transcript_32606:83-1021(+)